MAKIRYSDLKSVASEPSTNEPVLGEVDALLQAKSESFAGESDYDAGLTYNMNQARNRAFNQPWYDQIANSVVKTVPAIGLGILENAGYLGELLSEDQNYNNLFTELAKKGREKLEESNPVYRQDPEEVFDLTDSAWWINHGQGLVESVGEFLVTGAGVGGALGKGAKALAKALPLKLAESGSKVLTGAAQLSTASALAYTEGAMSGAQVYDRVLKETGDAQLAAKSAAETVRINTVLNTGLNITALGPLFRTNNKLNSAIRSGLNRGAKESTPDYIKRLTLLESQGVAPASMMKRLGLEAVQEGVEEDVNLFAEQEGLITGGLKKKRGSGLDRFLDVATTEEGALNFILGAVGGVAQTAGMEYLPLKTTTDSEGNKLRISARDLEIKDNAEYQKSVINSFKKDIETIQDLQQYMNEGVKNNNKEQVEQAKEALFNVGILKSLRNETSEELSKEIASIANIDNTNIGEDGMTDAMRQGLADNIDDNNYKEKAIRKASDIKMLNKEFRNLIAATEKPFVASELFRERLQVYGYESVLEDFKKEEGEIYTNLTKLIPDPSTLDVTKLQAEVDAYDALENAYKNDPTKLALVKSERVIADTLLRDTIESTGKQPDKRLTIELAQNLATQTNVKLKLNSAKSKYAESIADVNKFEKNLKKEEAELTKKRDEAVKAKQEAEAKAKRDADFAEAQKEAELAKEAANQAKQVNQDKLIGQILQVDGKDAKVIAVNRNLGGSVFSLEYEKPFEGDPNTTTTQEEINSRRGILYAKDGKLYTEAELKIAQSTTTEPVISQEGDIRREIRAAIQKAGQGEGGQFFVTLSDGTRLGATRMGSMNPNEINTSQGFVDIAVISKIENPDGTIIYSELDEDNKEDENFEGDEFLELTKKEAAEADKKEEIDIPAGPYQLNAINNVTDITTQATNEQGRKELERIENQLTEEDKLNPKIYGDYNKISYLAQDYDKTTKKTVDPFTINDSYKILHTPTINEGTVVTLKLAKETEWYEPNKTDVNKVPIGVYFDGKLVGYLPVYKGQSNALIQARNYIFKEGEVTDTISRKTDGNLNIAPRATVAENFSSTPKFAIGRNGAFEITLDTPYNQPLINNKTAVSGVTHAILPTPTGKDIALPVDMIYVSTEHVDSFMRVLELYFKERELTTDEQALVSQIEQEYEFNITNFKGLKTYFGMFFHGTNLDASTPEGKLTLELIEKETDRTNHYIQLTGKGVRFIESSGSLQEFTKDDFANTAKRERFVNHLVKTFYRSDITRINTKKAFEAPILNTKNLSYVRYSKPTYNDHLATVTRTNLATVKVAEGIHTALVQPSLFLSFEFLNKQSKENTKFTTDDGKKFVSLEQPKEQAILSKLTLDDYSDQEFTIDTNNPTKEDVEEVKKKCDS